MAEPKRWVIVKQFLHAVERTETEIAELTAHRLFVRDATGPDDKQDVPPDPMTSGVPQNTPPPPATPAAGATTTTPPGGKEKTTP